MHQGEITARLRDLREAARRDPRVNADRNALVERIGRWNVGLTANL